MRIRLGCAILCITVLAHRNASSQVVAEILVTPLGFDIRRSDRCPVPTPNLVSERFELASNVDQTMFAVVRWNESSAPNLAVANVGSILTTTDKPKGWNYQYCAPDGYQSAHSFRFVHLPTGIQSRAFAVMVKSPPLHSPAPAPDRSQRSSIENLSTNSHALADSGFNKLLRCFVFSRFVDSATGKPFGSRTIRLQADLVARAEKLKIPPSEFGKLVHQKNEEAISDFDPDTIDGLMRIPEEYKFCFDIFGKE